MKELLLFLLIILVGVEGQDSSGGEPGPVPTPSPPPSGGEPGPVPTPSPPPSGGHRNTHSEGVPHDSPSGPPVEKFFEILELVVFKECSTNDINDCLGRMENCARSVLLNGTPSQEHMKSTFKDCVKELGLTLEQDANLDTGHPPSFNFTKEEKADLMSCIMTKNGKFDPFVTCINGNVKTQAFDETEPTLKIKQH